MKKYIIRFFLFLTVLYLILLIPDRQDPPPALLHPHIPFTWNNDSIWKELENTFREAKQKQKQLSDSIIQSKKIMAEKYLTELDSGYHQPASAIFTSLQEIFFGLAPFIATDTFELPWYSDYYYRLRKAVKRQSQTWDISQAESKKTLYTTLYGMRAAYEEVLLQVPADKSYYLMPSHAGSQVPGGTSLFGIAVQSGDILVSRGGAEVSAFISRGNDYPGNFSHAALLYIDEKSQIPFLIEAHIEKGVAISGVDQYTRDKKLRFMVMRPRPGLAIIQQDPLLPHKAATFMYDEATRHHIPYDFKMNTGDPKAMFCSEVPAHAYQKYGLKPWKAASTISSDGVIRWLHDFGVDNFETEMPSDLEYDPSLDVVAEWRDPETLWKDHIDNAVMDALLEKANEGKEIGYNRFLLPVARMIKAYSFLKNCLGREGLIPEGMSATRALKNESLVNMNRKVKEKVIKAAGDFTREYHYTPPYWQLLKFARTAASDL
jgi:hypothetical protein